MLLFLTIKTFKIFKFSIKDKILYFRSLHSRLDQYLLLILLARKTREKSNHINVFVFRNVENESFETTSSSSSCLQIKGVRYVTVNRTRAKSHASQTAIDKQEEVGSEKVAFGCASFRLDSNLSTFSSKLYLLNQFTAKTHASTISHILILIHLPLLYRSFHSNLSLFIN